MQNANQLDGTWQALQAELAGNPWPPTVVSTILLTLAGGRYTMQNDSGSSLMLPGNRLEITGDNGPNSGKTFKAIWKLSSDTLTVCYNLTGDSWPEEFATKPGSQLLLVTFKKQ